MNIEERHMSLFDAPEKYYLVQCISADLMMGKGIAVEFNKRFDIKRKLINRFPYGIYDNNHWLNVSILEGNVFNLVTKEKFYYKPTYDTLKNALLDMKEQMVLLDIRHIAMPRIGCGLDKLIWSKVHTILIDIFNDVDVNFSIYSL